MKRAIIASLQQWLQAKNRKPLVLRGARQVGKTWLIREFAKLSGKQLVELNFEKQPGLASLFSSNDPIQMLSNIEAVLNISIQSTLEHQLLFLDEIQAAPELLSKLRWFAEELPALAVVATGSLLEFVLTKHTFSMPVGRINYAYLEPLSFEEFLAAINREKLVEFIQSVELNQPIPEAIHHQLLAHIKEYSIVGGMPAAVEHWSTEKSATGLQQKHHDLLATFQDDFAKYTGRLDVARIQEVFRAVPQKLGEKFVYRQINPEVQTLAVKNALELLVQARVCHKISATYANGLPLGAELNEKAFKVIFLDAGLVSTSLGYRLHQINTIEDINLINRGGLAEQLVGQMLRTIDPFYIKPELYYWSREQKGSAAEVDYVIQHGSDIVPLEVKSGSTGSLKSLHILMAAKKLTVALRVNSDYPSQVEVSAKTLTEQLANYRLISIPFYLVNQLHRLINHS